VILPVSNIEVATSFYADANDPFGNPIRFVDWKTFFTRSSDWPIANPRAASAAVGMDDPEGSSAGVEDDEAALQL
jgi:hypothetical protein